MPSGLPLSQALDPPAFVQIPQTDMDSIHMIEWERDIVWADSDDADGSQNGAAAPAMIHDWDDLDQALGVELPPSGLKSRPWQRPVPALEPLPKRADTGAYGMHSLKHSGRFTHLCSHQT